MRYRLVGIDRRSGDVTTLSTEAANEAAARTWAASVGLDVTDVSVERDQTTGAAPFGAAPGPAAADRPASVARRWTGAILAVLGLTVGVLGIVAKTTRLIDRWRNGPEPEPAALTPEEVQRLTDAGKPDWARAAERKTAEAMKQVGETQRQIDKARAVEAAWRAANPGKPFPRRPVTQPAQYFSTSRKDAAGRDVMENWVMDRDGTWVRQD